MQYTVKGWNIRFLLSNKTKAWPSLACICTLGGKVYVQETLRGGKKLKRRGKKKERNIKQLIHLAEHAYIHEFRVQLKSRTACYLSSFLSYSNPMQFDQSKVAGILDRSHPGPTGVDLFVSPPHVLCTNRHLPRIATTQSRWLVTD